MNPPAESPDFAKGDGLLPAIAQDAATGQVLMLAYMNQESYDETLRTGRAIYFSRSRNKLWRKGEESGHVQEVKAGEQPVQGEEGVVFQSVTQSGQMPVFLQFQHHIHARRDQRGNRTGAEMGHDELTFPDEGSALRSARPGR